MLTIGILAPNNSAEISNALQILFKHNRELFAVKKNSRTILDDIDLFEKSGIKYTIITFDKKKIYPVLLDVLILDNENNKKIVDYELVKCVGEKTILIYNTDNGYLPHIEHPNAIDYGFCSASSVSVSSINYNENNISLIISVQRSFCGLFYNTCQIGEFLIESCFITKISNLLPAVICGLVCDVINYAVVKI